MIEDIKKINLDKFTKAKTAKIRQVLISWHAFTSWLREEEDEEVLIECIAFEIENKKRAQFIDRIRTRYNKLKSMRELKELEDHCKMIINLNYLGN